MTLHFKRTDNNYRQARSPFPTTCCLFALISHSPLRSGRLCLLLPSLVCSYACILQSSVSSFLLNPTSTELCWTGDHVGHQGVPSPFVSQKCSAGLEPTGRKLSPVLSGFCCQYLSCFFVVLCLSFALSYRSFLMHSSVF